MEVVVWTVPRSAFQPSLIYGHCGAHRLMSPFEATVLSGQIVSNPFRYVLLRPGVATSIRAAGSARFSRPVVCLASRQATRLRCTS